MWLGAVPNPHSHTTTVNTYTSTVDFDQEIIYGNWKLDWQNVDETISEHTVHWTVYSWLGLLQGLGSNLTWKFDNMIRVNWIWFPRWRMMIVSVVLLWFGKAACFETEKIEISMATINYAYLSGEGSNLTFGPSLRGVYGLESKLEPERGTLVHVLTEDGANHACTPIMNAPKEGQWIALVQRGGCKFHSKIYTAGKLHNASAVIVYDNVEADPVSMAHNGKWCTHEKLYGLFTCLTQVITNV